MASPPDTMKADYEALRAAVVLFMDELDRGFSRTSTRQQLHQALQAGLPHPVTDPDPPSAEL